jgi:SAM-dependent methyltransferase
LKSEDRQRFVDLYGSRFRRFGHDIRTVGWGSRREQWLRFAVLCRNINLNGRRILDVGCGLGDFVAFVVARGIREFDYLGIDIVPELVEEAKKKFGGRGRQFITSDLLADRDFGEFDVVLSSGAFTLRVSDNLSLAKEAIARMFALSRHAVAINFLSTYVDYQRPKNFHYEPEAMFSYARSLTRWVRLHHDYPLYEFTLQLFHEPNWDAAEMKS